MEESDGTITAINAVTGEAIHNKAEGWYTIGGVKLEGKPTEKGVYINNGISKLDQVLSGDYKLGRISPRLF